MSVRTRYLMRRVLSYDSSQSTNSSTRASTLAHAVVAEKLALEGIQVELVDLRTISPLDEATLIASVAKTGRAVIVHEAVRKFGVGAEIAAMLNEHLFGQLKAPVQRIGSNQSPVPFSKTLEMAFVPQLSAIEAAIRKTLA